MSRAAVRAGIPGLLLAVACCVSPAVAAGPPPGSEYLDGGTSKVGVILCHGRGKYPTWKVVEPLRHGIRDALGYHTLSLRMPAQKKAPAQDYAAYFPRARAEIDAGIAFLRDERRVERIYLMGHSMGSRMASWYLAVNPGASVAGFIGVGIRNGGGAPLDSNANLRAVTIPVLDVYGDGQDDVDREHAAARSDMVSARYTQVLIAGANHTFDGHEEQMVSAVTDWLSRRD